MTSVGKGRRNSLFYKLRKRAFRKMPFLISDPDYREILEDSRYRDGEENAETRPPDAELVDLCCLWAAEFYTPSHVDRLLSGFADLGWSKDDDTLPGPNPALWVRQLRETAFGSGWFSLGVICRTGEKTFASIDRTAPLPPHVSYATGEIFSITSSTTCIVMGFALDEEYSRRMNQALRREHETYLERRRRGYRMHGPASQKKAALRVVRAHIRELATNWFRAHLPGLFSSGILDGEFPTCEFMTLRVGRPFPQPEERVEREEYLHLLDVGDDWDAWPCRDTPGLKFAWPVLRDEENRFHAIVAAREDDFAEENLRMYGGPGRSSYTAYVDRHLKGLLSRWALLAVLSGFERHLNAIRDSAIFRVDHRRKPRILLETLGAHLSQSVDIAAVSAELANTTQQKGSFNEEAGDFTPAHSVFGRTQDATAAEALRKHVGERAAWLQIADRSVRDLLTQYGTALAAAENIRLQHSVRWLTWILVFLTVTIAVLTAIMALTAT